MSGAPPKVTPAKLAAGEIESAFGGKSASTTEAWALLNGALGYWLPHGLNQGIRAARSARRGR